MEFLRYTLLGLIIIINALAAFFKEVVSNWLNEVVNWLPEFVASPTNLPLIVGILTMLTGVAVAWQKQPFTRRKFGIVVLAFGGFIFLYRFLETDKAFIVFASLALAFAAFLSFDESRRLRRDNVGREERDRKEHLLHEVRDWILETKNASLAPITADSLGFTEANITLRYGMALNKVEYFEKVVEKVFHDTDFKEKVSKVGEMIVALMVLEKAKSFELAIETKNFEEFLGYKVGYVP